ncbi:hypothetical protein TNCV_2495551 [Trichonephila clavipes]|nr:hypothetical protein TNCV_2495551 [Trichonephila clavipes]
MMDRISISEGEALAKWNEIDPFLKWTVTGEEKWITYDNIVRKRSWSKRVGPNTKLRYLLSTTGPFEASDQPETARIGQQKRCCVPSGQRQATHVCSDSPETLGALLGSFNASTIKFGPGTKRLPPFSCVAKLPE